MQVKLYKDYKTIDYKFILQRRPKAIEVDLGLEVNVWLPLEAIELNEADFQITGAGDFLDEKIREAEGEKPKRTPPRMVKLKTPDWQSDRAYGFDVKVSRKGTEGYKARVFFPKSKVKNGEAPAWLVERKEAEIIAQVNVGSKIPNSEFTVSGLIAQKTKSGNSGHRQPSQSQNLTYSKS